MELNVESIRALDPGKVYVVEMDPDAYDCADGLIELGASCDIHFIVIPKGIVEVVSAPEGLEVTVTKKERSLVDIAFDLMEKELLEYLTNWADAKVRDCTVEEVATQLRAAYLSNQAHECDHDPVYLTDEWATEFLDWPQNVPPERFLAIAKKWKS